jgi:hypothetical protein
VARKYNTAAADEEEKTTGDQLIDESRCPLKTESQADLYALAKIAGLKYCEEVQLAVDDYINRQKIKSQCKSGDIRDERCRYVDM